MAKTRFRVERLTTLSLPLAGSVLPEPDPRYELVEPGPSDLEDFHASEPAGFTARKRDQLSARLGGQERAWLVRDREGRWIGWCHLVRGRGPNGRINHTLRLAPDEVYLFDDGTIRSRRRQGVHTFTIAARLQIARSSGAARAITTIANHNRASLASYRRLGFRPRSQIIHVPALRHSIELPLTPGWVRRLRHRQRRHD